MHIIKKLFLFALSFCIALTSCEKEKEREINRISTFTSPEIPKEKAPEKHYTRKTQHVFIFCEDTIRSSGTIITDSYGQYVITARAVFSTPGHYRACMKMNDSTAWTSIIKTDSNTANELCVCLIGKDEQTLIGKLPKSKTVESIEHALKDLDHIGVIWNPGATRQSVTDRRHHTKIVDWPKMPQQIECLDVFPVNGSCGTGYIDPKHEHMFWISIGAWPEAITTELRIKLGRTDTKEFTMIAGLHWDEIDTIRTELLGQ